MAATLLITGANGFIGSHCTKLMESAGHKVVAIDVVPRAPDLALLGIKATTQLMNVTDGAAFRALCEKERPTHLFHAAHPPRDETPTVLDYCYKAMTNILEAAKDLKYPTCRLLQLGIDLWPGQQSRGRSGQRRRRRDDLPDLFLPRRENRLRMDRKLLPGETWRRLRRSEIFLGLWPGTLSQHPVGIEKRHPRPPLPAVSHPPAGRSNFRRRCRRRYQPRPFHCRPAQQSLQHRPRQSLRQ